MKPKETLLEGHGYVYITKLECELLFNSVALYFVAKMSITDLK